MQVTTRVENLDKVQAELRAAHYRAPNAVRTALREAGQLEVEPRILIRAPSVTKPFITTRGTNTRLYVTTKGPKQGDRITGLLNFGGYLDTPIFPKGRRTRGTAGSRIKVGQRAVSTPWGPRSVVWRGVGGRGRPGYVTGKHFMEAGIAESVEPTMRRFRDNVLAAFEPLPTDSF